jgi:hypothetical protein
VPLRLGCLGHRTWAGVVACALCPPRGGATAEARCLRMIRWHVGCDPTLIEMMMGYLRQFAQIVRDRSERAKVVKDLEAAFVTVRQYSDQRLPPSAPHDMPRAVPPFPPRSEQYTRLCAQACMRMFTRRQGLGREADSEPGYHQPCKRASRSTSAFVRLYAR